MSTDTSLFLGNYYWVPGTKQEDVKVLQYADRLKIYRGRTLLAEYPLPADGVKNAHFSPEGQPPPRHLPKHRSHGSQHEEQRLRALDPAVAAYVDFALQTPGIQRHRFLRELFALSRKVTPAVFAEALTRARRYRVVRDGNPPAHRLALHEPGTGTPARRGGGRELPPASGLPGGLFDRRAGPVRL